jgi:hypothetical protein
MYGVYSVNLDDSFFEICNLLETKTSERIFLRNKTILCHFEDLVFEGKNL